MPDDAVGPYDVLREEHESIEHLLQAVEGMAAAVEEGRAVHLGDLEAALQAAVQYADGCHHGKEEEVLFPALREAAPDEGAKVARELEGDLMAGRKLLTTLREVAPRAAAGEARAEFARHARLYAKLLRAHIALEDRRLEPLAARALDARRQAEVVDAFGRLERERLGEGRERFEHLIRDLHGRWSRGA